jgi:hypothetical protein
MYDSRPTEEEKELGEGWGKRRRRRRRRRRRLRGGSLSQDERGQHLRAR